MSSHTGSRGRFCHGTSGHPLLTAVRMAENTTGGLLLSATVAALNIVTWPARFALSCTFGVCRALSTAVTFPVSVLSAYSRERQLVGEVHDLSAEVEGFESLTMDLQLEIKELAARHTQALQRIALLREQRRGLVNAALTASQQVSNLKERVRALESELVTAREAKVAAEVAAAAATLSSSANVVDAGEERLREHFPMEGRALKKKRNGSTEELGGASLQASESAAQGKVVKEEVAEMQQEGEHGQGETLEGEGQIQGYLVDVSVLQSFEEYRKLLASGCRASTILWIVSIVLQILLARSTPGPDLAYPVTLSEVSHSVLWLIITISGFNALRFFFLGASLRRTRRRVIAITSTGFSTQGKATANFCRGSWIDSAPTAEEPAAQSLDSSASNTWHLSNWFWGPDGGMWLLVYSCLALGFFVPFFFVLLPEIPRRLFQFVFFLWKKLLELANTPVHKGLL